MLKKLFLIFFIIFSFQSTAFASNYMPEFNLRLSGGLSSGIALGVSLSTVFAKNFEIEFVKQSMINGDDSTHINSKIIGRFGYIKDFLGYKKIGSHFRLSFLSGIEYVDYTHDHEINFQKVKGVGFQIGSRVQYGYKFYKHFGLIAGFSFLLDLFPITSLYTEEHKNDDNLFFMLGSSTSFTAFFFTGFVF